MPIVVPEKEPLMDVAADIALQWSQGVVLYYVEKSHFGGNEWVSIFNQRLKSAMGVLEGSSCLRFIELQRIPVYTNPKDVFLYIANPDKIQDCQHQVKRLPSRPGALLVYFGSACLTHTDMIHTLMHAIGFPDEVSNPTRDKYIRIQWDNIDPANRHLFTLDHSYAIFRKIEFDPTSIMMFHSRAFTVNGHITIDTVLPGLTLKPSKELSHLDKLKLHKVFRAACNKRQVRELVDYCQYNQNP